MSSLTVAADVILPKRYRPMGARLAAGVAGVALAAVMTLLWVSLPADVRADFTTFQRLTLLVVFGTILALLYAVFRTSVLADELGLTVVNGFHAQQHTWPQVVRISLSEGRPWALLDLTDGSTVAVMALQTADGDRARTSVRELVRVMAEQTPNAPDR